MPKYLLQVNYTLDGVRGLLAKGGSAREAAARAAVKSAGGQLEAFYFALGSTDVYLIADLPDNAAVASVALITAASGAVTVSTTALLTPAEIDTASGTRVEYQPPGS